MRNYIFSKETFIFILLVLFTFSSWYVSSFGKGSMTSGPVGGVVVLFFAFFKARLVIQYFMEVREAKVVLRVLTEIWVVLALIIVSSIYYFQL